MPPCYRWVIACFEDGPLLRRLGPLFFVQVLPERLCGNFDNAWSRFLLVMGEPDNEASRRKYRKRGYRRVKVEVIVVLVESATPAETEP